MNNVNNFPIPEYNANQSSPSSAQKGVLDSPTPGRKGRSVSHKVTSNENPFLSRVHGKLSHVTRATRGL